MIHQRQRLSLGLEARDDLLGVHAELDDFERDAPANRLFLFCHINHAASAFSDLLKQFVATNSVARFFRERNFQCDGFIWRRRGRFVQKITSVIVRLEQTLDVRA